MEMIEVVNPSLNEYMARVRSLASRYLGNEDMWFTLNSSAISDEDDRDEFSFIRMALWDKLMEREFFTLSSPPGQIGLFSHCETVEPGATIPGSLIWEGEDWVPIATQRSSTAFLTLATS
jgi:hypothetical protein